MKRFYFFIGTSAEFIKLAPIIRRFKQQRVKFKIITSGQNLINFKDLEKYTGDLTPNFELPQKFTKSSITSFTKTTFEPSFFLFFKACL